jgi:serine/threonine protein kinase
MTKMDKVCTTPKRPGCRGNTSTAEILNLSREKAGAAIPELIRRYLSQVAKLLRERLGMNKNALEAALEDLVNRGSGIMEVIGYGGEKVALAFNSHPGHVYLMYRDQTRFSNLDEAVVYGELSQKSGETEYFEKPIEFTDLNGNTVYCLMSRRCLLDLFDAIVGGKINGPEEKAQVMRSVMESLQKLHEKGIVHRDIKPDNVVIRETSRGKRARLTDFGLSKKITKTGQMSTKCYGTLGWEGDCFSGEYDVVLNDIYVLALLLYTILTGSAPRPYEIRKNHNEWPRWHLDGEDIDTELMQTYPNFWPKVVQALHPASQADKRPTLEQMIEALNLDTNDN